jgi:hypothetical protein
MGTVYVQNKMMSPCYSNFEDDMDFMDLTEHKKPVKVLPPLKVPQLLNYVQKQKRPNMDRN